MTPDDPLADERAAAADLRNHEDDGWCRRVGGIRLSLDDVPSWDEVDQL
jgi:hypothetical protein